MKPPQNTGSGPSHPAPTPAIPIKAATPAENTQKFGIPFTFRFRRHIGGNFPGLWELSSVDPDGRVTVAIDADNLTSCLEAVAASFEERGL